ncbi:type II CAAX endopeptidase family protein [Flammeovirgaceae bacterium SG7u.111]|nr:type II CAAX endopeptidase family protein [Flammeovirgaceae bacterium SG7u.132]WPO38327.1 type II CAAX endopeptidase family protein [Flammeovirgaceae bacterium SG7u.111]
MDVSIILIYGLLLFSVISIWVRLKLFNKIPLWMFLLASSFVLAIIFEKASFISLGYTLLFGLSVYYFYQTKNIWLFFVVLALSIPLFIHLPILGFNNYRYLHNITLTASSTPYSLYFNLDKTLVGVCIIGFSFDYKKIELRPILKLLAINLVLMILVFFVLAITLGYSKFDPKLPYFTPAWILANLFFTCMAEEALFRKLLQQRIADFSKGKYTAAISISVASALFGLVHYKGGVVYIISAALAGIFYGYMYHKSKRIEGAILLHFTFNLTHFLLFTYPALK